MHGQPNTKIIILSYLHLLNPLIKEGDVTTTHKFFQSGITLKTKGLYDTGFILQNVHRLSGQQRRFPFLHLTALPATQYYI
jgi:hypothetical protein